MKIVCKLAAVGLYSVVPVCLWFNVFQRDGSLDILLVYITDDICSENAGFLRVRRPLRMMHNIFGNRFVSPANVLGAVAFVGYFAVNTILFAHVSHRLDIALLRVDKLELFIANTIGTHDGQAKKERTFKSWLESVEDGLNARVGGTGEKDILRARRGIRHKRGNPDVKTFEKWKRRFERRFNRLKTRCKCNMTKTKGTTKKTQSSRKKKDNGDHSRSDTRTLPRKKKGIGNGDESLPKCSPIYRNVNVHRKTNALFTVWGNDKCITGSKKIAIGQTVTSDGSNYLCLPDKGPEALFTPTSSRKKGTSRSVKIRGVTYGDVEDAVAIDIPPAIDDPNSKNNKTVPCAICSRVNKTMSVMLLSVDPDNLPDPDMQREYVGVLMSAAHSSKFICVSISPQNYTGNGARKAKKLVDTVSIHPAELKCDSLYCEASPKYNDKHRVSCLVGTI